jgi:purine-binding chemotaxis protein CheW
MNASAATSPAMELLSFRLSEQDYCVDIMSVREIRGSTRTTSLPHAPDYVRGVINLRGTILPVIDLSRRFGLPPADADARNVIIVVQVDGRTFGLLVDAVSDILALPASELQPPPQIAEGSAGLVRSLAIVEGRMLRVLDLDAVVPKTRGDVV